MASIWLMVLSYLKGRLEKEIVLELQLTTHLPGPKCSGSYSSQASLQSLAWHWKGKGGEMITLEEVDCRKQLAGL